MTYSEKVFSQEFKFFGFLGCTNDKNVECLFDLKDRKPQHQPRRTIL
jgi:hypothetical protein